MNKFIDDIKCPYCEENNCYIFDTDECEFSFDGTGHYIVDVSCPHCKKNHRHYYYFKYVITEEWSD